MNFFGHAVIGLWHSHDRRFLLGTMLPDLSGMLGIRLGQTGDSAVAAGVALHHVTDAAFHGSERFVALCSQTVETLTSIGVGRGTSRAVAHVGTELLLDGLLSREGSARAAYADTLAHAVEERLSETLHLASDDRLRLHRGLCRLRQAPLPEAYCDAGFVSDRLRAILASRPRLAMQADDLPKVEHEVRRLSGQVAATWEQILDQVRARLT